MNTIDLIEQVLGIPGLFTKGLYDKYGPWWGARRLLQEVWKKKPQVIRDASFDLRQEGMPFYEAGKDIAWRRDIDSHMIGWHVHHVDKNSQYLSANRGMYTGIGDPIHVSDGDDGTHIEPKLPGAYRITDVTNNMSTFDDCGFPPIIKPGQKWITKDVLLFARKHGYSFTIQEAWVFSDYARVLDEWAYRIWNARSALKGIDDAAYRKMKSIAIVGNGAWATNAETHPGVDLIHPNWWCDTVGKARCALLANLLKYGAPHLIETDGLYYITRDPNPQTAILSIDEGASIMARKDESGGYKHKGSCILTDALYRQSIGLIPGKLADLFKEAIKEAMKNGTG